MIAFCKWYNKENSTNIYFKDYTEITKHIPKIKHINQSYKIWWDFFETKDHYNMNPIENAVTTLNKLSKKNNLYIITSRHNIAKQSTEKWIKKHFGNIFKEIIYLEYFIENKNQLLRQESELTIDNKIRIVKNKAQIAKDLKIDIIIDDTVSNLVPCARKGIKCILFQPTERYNKEQLTNLNKNIIIAHSWKEIEKEIKKIEDN